MKLLRKALRRLLLAISPSYNAVSRLRKENSKLHQSNRKLRRKVDLLLKGQSSLPQITSSIKSLGDNLSRMSDTLTEVMLLNKDKLNHDIVKDLEFDRIGGIKVAHSVFDTSYQGTSHFLNEALGTNAKDANHPYNFSHIDFKEGDVVIDIGGNLGLTSICLARMFPFLRIYCFEPVPETFRYLLRNLELNHVTNVHAFQLAVTIDGRDLEFTFNETRSVRSGNVVNARMAASFNPRKELVRSIAFDEVFRSHDIRRCKLLKIDCEGFEYELLNRTEMLSRIEYVSGETHGGKDETIALFKHIGKSIPKEKMAFSVVGSRKTNYCHGEIEPDELFD